MARDGNVVVHVGATPVFVDVHDSDLNIDPIEVAKAVTPRTKAILPVDLAGQPADLDPLLELGVPVIEDAAHAVGAEYRGRPIGSIAPRRASPSTRRRTSPPVKGGVVTTNDEALADELRELRLMRRGDGSLYDIRVAGFKANLSDVLAAIALCQLDKLEAHAEIRRRHVQAYDVAVEELEGVTPLERDPRDQHAMHLYVVRIDAEKAGADRDAYQRALAEENIGTSIHFLPVHTLSYYRAHYPDQSRLPIAERAGGEVLSLPLSPAHSDADIGDAIEALRRVHASFTVEQTRPHPHPGPGERCHPRLPHLAGRSRRDDRHPRRQQPRYCRRGRRALRRHDVGDGLALAGAARLEGTHEPIAWLTKLYFVSYAVGQVLPTAVGGDAVRIVEHARKRPDAKAEAAAAVLMERVIGSVGTLVVVALGLAIAAGRYEDVRFVAWIEAAAVLGTILFLVLIFSRRTGRHLVERVFPLGRRLRLERPVTSLYQAMHEYRGQPSVLLFVLGLTIVTQLARVVGIWFCGEAVGIDVSPLVYFVLGPSLLRADGPVHAQRPRRA